MKQYDEKACGIIPIFEDPTGEHIEYLLIQQNQGHWTFPKGHKEEEEICMETALRELKEETGIGTVSLIDGFLAKDEYISKVETHALKQVTYYIGEVESKDVVTQEEEVRAYRWLPYGEALDQITFENTKEVLTKAHAFLTQP